MLEENVPDLIQTTSLETIVAALRKRAEQVKVTLPQDRAFYIAHNIQSNARVWELLFKRHMAHSTVNGTQTSLVIYVQRILRDLIEKEARAAVDLLRKRQFGEQETEVGHLDSTVADQDFVVCLLETRKRTSSLVKHELEVNMREHERGGLARRDAYERESECRAKKRRQA